jgi:hypothetical protein
MVSSKNIFVPLTKMLPPSLVEWSNMVKWALEVRSVDELYVRREGCFSILPKKLVQIPRLIDSVNSVQALTPEENELVNETFELFEARMRRSSNTELDKMVNDMVIDSFATAMHLV